VSKEKWKRRECASPATIPHGDVIKRNVRYSILRGKEGCLEGRDCGRVVKALTVFVLGPSELLLKRGWWAIRESSVRNLNTRLDEAIEPEMDEARGGEAVDGGGDEWVGKGRR